MVKNLYIWGGLAAWGFLAILMAFYTLDKHYAQIRADLVTRGEEVSS